MTMTKNTLTEEELFLKQSAGEMDLGGYLVPVVNAPVILLPALRPLMLKDNSKFAAIYWDQPEGRRFILFSNKGCTNVGEVAKYYRGTGDENTAAFTTPPQQEIASEWIPLALETPPDDIDVVILLKFDDGTLDARLTHHEADGKMEYDEDLELHDAVILAWSYAPELPAGLERIEATAEPQTH